MPKVAYSEEQRAQLRDDLITVALELMTKQGIQSTAVEQICTRVGISRTFFYSFFPAKEDLVVQAFYRQQPQILAHAQKLMNNPELSWRDGVEQFFHNINSDGQIRFAIMSVEEQKSLYKCLSEESRQSFQDRQLTFLTDLLHIFHIYADTPTIKLLSNLVISTLILHKAIPNTLPFLFSDAADEMTNFQIDAILNYMETLREY